LMQQQLRLLHQRMQESPPDETRIPLDEVPPHY